MLQIIAWRSQAIVQRELSVEPSPDSLETKPSRSEDSCNMTKVKLSKEGSSPRSRNRTRLSSRWVGMLLKLIRLSFSTWRCGI
jgi:hypothetical protein